MKKCPYCAEEIQYEAIVCRYCGRDLAGSHPTVETPAKSKPRPVRIALAVLFAGTVPPVAAYVVLYVAISLMGMAAVNEPPFRPAYLLLYFVLHVLPLALGFWAGAAWPGKHTKGIAMLAVLAGAAEAVADWFLVTFHNSFLVPILQLYWNFELRTEDFIALFTTAALFMAGGLFADLVERWRSLRSNREAMLAQGAAIQPSSLDEEQNKMMLLLIQSLGPAALTLVGTITAAVITTTLD